jgi:hypothetical protein
MERTIMTKRTKKRARKLRDSLKKPARLAASKASVLKGSSHARVAKAAKKTGRAGVDWRAAGLKAWATRQKNALARAQSAAAEAATDTLAETPFAAGPVTATVRP